MTLRVADYKDELHGLSGSTTDAVRTSLLRYFHLLRMAKASLREKLDEADQMDLANAARTLHVRGNVELDLANIREQLPGEVSDSCADKLEHITDLERIALLDALERTHNLTRQLKESLTGPNCYFSQKT